MELFGLSSQDPYDHYGEDDPDRGYARDQHSEEALDVIPLRADRAEFAGVTIIRAEPKNMEEATAVANEIKHRLPVLLNLQNAPESEAMRIRDFLGGVTYGLNGHMRCIAKWVYICSPFDMPVEKLVLGSQPAADRERSDVFAAADAY